MASFRTSGAVVALVLGLAACGSDETVDSSGPSTTDGGGPTGATALGEPVIDPGDGGNYEVTLDPADFVETIDNPYMPLAPGSRWVYEGEADGELERVEIVVTDERREILGISAVVVRDTVTDAEGTLIEDTFDWFAQDRDGNVWYLGETTEEYENGEVVSTEGSWEAGVDGALPGIIMLASPDVGHAYRQEYYVGEAEDLAEVVRLHAEESVAFAPVSDLVVIREWTPLTPEAVEEKYYAAGIGMVLEIHTAGGESRLELIEFTAGT